MELPEDLERQKLNQVNRPKRRNISEICDLDSFQKFSINHIDLNDSNNKLTNLEFTTNADNNRHSFKTDNKRKNQKRKTLGKPLRCIQTFDGRDVVHRILAKKKGEDTWTLEFENQFEAHKSLNIETSYIVKVAKGIRKSTHGYNFEFIIDKTWIYFNSIMEAAENLNLIHNNISDVCNKKSKHTGGYYFEFVEDTMLDGEYMRKNELRGMYITNKGRIVNVNNRISFGSLKKTGYYTTIFKQKDYMVHRLVVETFKWSEVERKYKTFCQENPESKKDIMEFWKTKLQVHHIDNNKGNNCIENLIPLTPLEHAQFTKKITRKSNATALGVPIEGKRLEETTWVWYESEVDAAIKLFGHKKFNQRVSKVCNGIHRQYKKYEFRFAEQPDLDGEVWRPIPQKFFKRDVSNSYASNKGRIKTRNGKKTFGCKRQDGRYTYAYHQVHRLIAAAFLDKMSITEY
tara:strand:- start:6836 stop:8212 length:1377 start_codon:yes stop_codon:yes gene_type:complete